MNVATEFDIGPLTWVKNEIDLALERASEALRQFSDSALTSSGDLTQIKFCRTYLHQVQGALTIVGLDGVTQFSEALESLLSAIEQKPSLVNETSSELAQRALSAMGVYLNELVEGRPNQPLRLFPLYQEVQAAHGMTDVSPSDLFFPDLSIRLPERKTPLKRVSPDEFQRILRHARAHFQRGFLAWLRAPNAPDGANEMLTAVRSIEEIQSVASARAFWWIATGFLSALAEGTLADKTYVKPLCARIDLQIRRLLEGSKNIAERLMRDTLYFVACADSQSPAIQQIKDAYRLQTLVPKAEMPNAVLQDGVLRKLREAISGSEDSWNKYCAGTPSALATFCEQAIALALAVEQLKSMDYRRLAQAIVATAKWLAEDSRRYTESLSMEVATAILLAQNAQENFERLGQDFAHQVDVTVARIHGCLSGTPPQPGSEIPLLDEMSRIAQEKLLSSHVAKEIQSNLAQIEQILDAFFRNPEKRADLANLDTPLKQVAGALTMLRHESAVVVLRECASAIQAFLDPQYEPDQNAFERVANQLSLLGFFIDSPNFNDSDFDNFVAKAQQARQPKQDEHEEDHQEPLVTGDTAKTPAAEIIAPKASFEQELTQQKLETHTLLDSLKKQPDDAKLREEIRLNLTSLKNDADLVADTTLKEQTKVMLSALDSGKDAAPEIDQTMASFKPQQTDVQKPSEKTLQLSQSSNEEIDAELLGIFLEEANEVLQAIEKSLQGLKTQPQDSELLTNIRRAYHTLKGSGRMVGLKDLGEAAWAIEQTLNIWLRRELALNKAMFALLEISHTIFSDWVLQLETGSGEVPESSEMIALAESLRRDDNPASIDSVSIDPQNKASEAPAQAEQSVPQPLELVAEKSPHSAEIINFSAVRHQNAENIHATEPDAPAQASEFADLADLAEHNEFFAEPPLELDALSLSLSDSAASANFGHPSVESTLNAEAEPDAPAQAPEFAEHPELDEFFAQPAPPFEFELDALTLSTTEIDLTTAHQAPVGSAETEPTDFVIKPIDATQQPIAISPALYAIFSEEARAHWVTLHRELAKLEANEAAATEHDMYRAAHTLAGIAGTVGLAPINQLGLALEHALLRRDHSTQQTSLEALSFIHQAVSELDLMLAAVSRHSLPETPTHLVNALKQLYPANMAAADQRPAIRAELTEQEKAQLEPVLAGHKPLAPRIATAHLSDEIDTQLLPIFLEEALDLTRDIGIQLRAWRTAPAKNEPLPILARLLHTLKGSARMAGAMSVGEITHAIEARVEEASAGGPTPLAVIDDIDAAFEAVLQIIDRLQGAESLAPLTPISAAAEATPSAAAAPVDEADDTHAEAVDVSDPAQRATLRVRADLIDRVSNEVGELSIARSRIEGEMRSLKASLLDLTENVIRLRRQLREIEIQAESQMQSQALQISPTHADFDPLELDRFTQFQELTRMMAESVNDVATVQQSLLKNLDDANAAIAAQARLNRELQQELMAVRMMPFGSLSERLYRVARQTSKELNKRVHLDIQDDHVELDRSVLEKIAAPLEHLLRNSVVHGLENRALRLAQGKPEVGEISLKLEQDGNEVIVHFADDGAGLNLTRIRERAIAAGLLAEHEIADEERLAEFIFAPGFSTATEVSQVAGRGVGMDVVKTEIAQIGGRVDVFSTAGKGTEFRLSIPLTLAVTKALLVRVGSKTYAIPAVMIEQVLDLKEDSLERLRIAGKTEWMGNTYPFKKLSALLDDPTPPEKRRQYWVLLLRNGAQRLAVQIDELLGNEEIVVKNIGPQLARIVGISGATVLGDGQVILILNPVALNRRNSAHAPAGLVTTASSALPSLSEAPAPIVLPTVMIVDDSLTVRKITGRLLAREGYQLLTAKDGVDALEQLHALEHVPDVMLVDIEMPRMDGFDLTRGIRANERFKAIPIIMITSRTAEKHRTYAFEIGVNHYLGKPYQEDELLSLIAAQIAARNLLDH